MSRPRTISTADILEKAQKLFLDQGVQVSTATIAKSVGLSQAALFKRFKTKRELLLAALVSPELLQRLEELLTWIDSQPEKAMRKQALQPIIKELLLRVWTVLNDVMPRIVALHNTPGLLANNHKFFNVEHAPPVQILNHIDAFVARCQSIDGIDKDLDSRQIALNIMGTIQGRALFKYILKMEDSFVDDDSYIDQTARVLTRAICPQEQ